MSINGRPHQEDAVCLYKGILLGHKKEISSAFCNNVAAPRDDQTKRSKSDKDKQGHHLYVEPKIWQKRTSP